MIRIRESYNLQPARMLMKKYGFEEFNGYLTDIREYSGIVMFKAHGFTAIYNYPPDIFTFIGEKSVSSFKVGIKNIKKIDVCAAHVDIYTTNGSVAEIWN